MTLRASSKDRFDTFLRVAAASTADPPWFAAPVDAAEDDDALTVVFHVAGRKRTDLRVQANEQTLRVWGVRQGRGRLEVRVCALPWPIASKGLHTAHRDDLLEVRIPKKRPDPGTP